MLDGTTLEAEELPPTTDSDNVGALNHHVPFLGQRVLRFAAPQTIRKTSAADTTRFTTVGFDMHLFPTTCSPVADLVLQQADDDRGRC